jgi:hypothetical protein
MSFLRPVFLFAGGGGRVEVKPAQGLQRFFSLSPQLYETLLIGGQTSRSSRNPYVEGGWWVIDRMLLPDDH